MIRRPMAMSAFARALRRHGPALDTWPPALREAARALLARDAGARQRYLNALDQEAALGSTILTEPANDENGLDQLAARLVATQQAPRKRSLVPMLGLILLLFCAGLGAWLGLRPAPQDRLQAVVAYVLDDGEAP